MFQAGRNRWITSCVAVGLALSAQSALAQSNVTIYGVIDAGLEVIDGLPDGTGKSTAVRVTTNNQQASRLGFRGTEDLGGGLKVLFALENGFATDTGTALQSGRLFGRAAFVGLNGNWGQLTMGRQSNTIFDLHLQYIPLGYTSYGPVAADMAFFTQRVDNSVKYTFKQGGFSSSWLYSLGRDALAGTPAGSQSEVAGNAKIGRQMGANANYAAGALSIAAGYDRQNGTTAALASETDTRLYLAAKYNISGNTLYAGMMRRNNDIPAIDAVNDLTWIGIRHPVTDKFGIAGWVWHTKLKNTADKATVVGTSLFYDFSKRSQGYLNLAYATNGGASKQGVSSAAAALPGDTQSGLALGIAHSF